MIRMWWRSIYEWLTRVEPSFPTVTNPAKDRSLPGKQRRKARRRYIPTGGRLDRKRVEWELHDKALRQFDNDHVYNHLVRCGGCRG